MKKTSAPLTFDWETHDRSFLRMGAAFLVMLGGFAGMFIIFRVVTPESRPVDVRPQRVMLLNPAVPEERALINLAMDRSFGMLPSEMTVAGPRKLLRLPTFVPSFSREELRLKPLPTGLAATTQMRPFALDMDVLPPLPAPAAAERPSPSQPAVLKAIIQGDLSSRAPADLVIPDIPLADSTRPRFQVAVGAMGQVVVALPLSASDDGVINQKLHHAITQMRFLPRRSEASKTQIPSDSKNTNSDNTLTDTDVTWGQVGFKWEAAAP